MKRLIPGGVATLVLLLVVGAASAAVANPNLVPGKPAYMALGDSWAFGEGAEVPGTGGYVARLAGALQEDLDCLPAESDRAADGCAHLQLLNLARPGWNGLPGVTAPIVESEQLPIAVPLLEERNGDANPRNDIEVVTLHVGGNDVSGPIQNACIGGLTPACLGTWIGEMAAFEADLRTVVQQIRAAAGDEMPIVLGTYGNPVPYCYLAAVPGAIQLGAMLLEGTPGGFPIDLDGVHDVVRRVAADYDAKVAEVFSELGDGDFVGGTDCLHMTDSGHEKVAAAFIATIDL